jgi:hypothetical protein
MDIKEKYRRKEITLLRKEKKKMSQQKFCLTKLISKELPYTH